MATYKIRLALLVVVVTFLGCNQTDDVAEQLRGVGATVYADIDLARFTAQAPIVQNRGAVKIPASEIAGVSFHHGTKLEKSHAELLNAAASIRLLNVSYCEIGSDFFGAFNGRNLEFLFAEKCELSNGDCEKVSTFPTLKQLSIRDSELTATGLQYFESKRGFKINKSY
jgi:hypothetical protein